MLAGDGCHTCGITALGCLHAHAAPKQHENQVAAAVRNCLGSQLCQTWLIHQLGRDNGAALEQQLRAVTDERDNLRSRLAAARLRIDTLIDRLPADPVASLAAGATPPAAAEVAAPADDGQADGSAA